MKKFILISILTLTPIYASAQYIDDLGVRLQFCPMLNVVADECGRGCTHSDAGKPCDIGKPFWPILPQINF